MADLKELKKEMIAVKETVQVYSKGPFASRFDALTDVRDMDFPHEAPPMGHSVHVFPIGDQWFWRSQPRPYKGLQP